jgi:integrase
VRSFHRVQGQPLPDLALAQGVLRGYERNRSEQPGNTDGQGAPGLRLPTLAQLFEVCDPATNAGARDRALLSLGWAIMGRRSELAGLAIDHVSRPGRGGLWVLIRRSKTDQLGRGVKVYVPWKPELGDLCPVTNVVRWQDRLAGEGITGGGLLRGVDKGDNINGVGRRYAGVAADWMDPATVELTIARAAVRALVPDAGKYTAHSLRRGGATDMYAAGADILAIARQGRWGERSPVIFRYIDEAATQLRNALRIGDFRRVLADEVGLGPEPEPAEWGEV